jgi:hypothetical protein
MTKKYTKAIMFVAVIASAMVLMTACNCSQQSSKNKVSKQEIEREVKDLVYPMPTSFEVTEMLNRIGAAYILNLSNAPSGAGKYITEKSQALNLGVYGADLSYASTYRQKQETLDFMTASKKLIDELNITAAIDAEIIDKIEQSADNKEQLVDLITNSFHDTYRFLQKNDRAALSALIMTGSWVEGLYIATHISEDTFNNKEMVQIIMNQKESLTKLVEILKQYPGNDDVMDMLNQVMKVKNIYDSVDGAISEAQFNSIKTEVRLLRDKIVA